MEDETDLVQAVSTYRTALGPIVEVAPAAMAVVLFVVAFVRIIGSFFLGRAELSNNQRCACCHRLNQQKSP